MKKILAILGASAVLYVLVLYFHGRRLQEGDTTIWQYWLEGAIFGMLLVAVYHGWKSLARRFFNLTPFRLEEADPHSSTKPKENYYVMTIVAFALLAVTLPKVGMAIFLSVVLYGSWQFFSD